ncbi:hypothetical protein Emed_007229 [Eimeria media]
MAAAESNRPFRLLGFHRNVTTLQLEGNYPFYAETAGRCLDTQITTAFGSRCLPRLLSQIQTASRLSRDQLLEALLCLGECLTNPGEEEPCVKRLDDAEPQTSDHVNDKGNSRFQFLAESPLQRACIVYLAGSNAQSPAAAWGLHAVGDNDAYAAVQAAVLQLLVSLSRLLSSELLAAVCGEDDGGALLAAAGVDSHLASFLCVASWALPPPESRRLLRNAVVAACSAATQPAARARMVTSSLVPASARLLWLLEPELSCMEGGVHAEASDAAAAAVSLEGLIEPSPMPALTAALETASMLLRLVALLATDAVTARMAASPEVIAAACRYTKLMWFSVASEPLNLLCRIACTEEGRQALVDNADFLRLLPLLLSEPTERQWKECEMQRCLQVQQQVPIQRGQLLPLVIQVLRSACAVPRFQHELYRHLKRRRQVMYEVLGVAAMKPAAALLAEALERMQLKERDLLQTELDEPHEGWLRFLVESDHAYKDACTDALQALSLMEFTLEKSAAFEPSEGPTGARWAKRFVPGIEGSLTKARNADNLGLRAAASACIQLMRAS